MGDWLDQLKDYGEKILSVTSVEGWLISAMAAIIITMVWYFRSQTFADSIVSKSTIRARNQATIKIGQDAITEAFEGCVTKGTLTREQADDLYSKVKKGIPAMKELGPEPSFGKPWYYGVKPSNLAETKNRIIARLMGMGMSTHELWTKKKNLQMARANEKTASEDLNDLVAAIRKHDKV